MRFIIGTAFGLLMAALVNAVGLDNVISALRAAESVTKRALHEGSAAVGKATEDRSHGR